MNTVRKFDIDPLLTHEHDSQFVDAQQIYTVTRARLVSDRQVSEFELKEHLDLLDDLMAFSLGRFWLQNRRLNGFWYDYVMRRYANQQVSNTLEQRILDSLPITLAKRHSYKIIQEFLQSILQENIAIAASPCGVMGDMLTLDYGTLKNFQLFGIDSDFESLSTAASWAIENNLSTVITLIQADTASLDVSKEYHVMVHQGWNVQEKGQASLEEKFSCCFKALKPGGVFVTSFLTPSPDQSKGSTWNMDVIDPKMLRLQNILFSEIIHAPEEVPETLETISETLKKVGFSDVEFIPDASGMVVTVLAKV